MLLQRSEKCLNFPLEFTYSQNSNFITMFKYVTLITFNSCVAVEYRGKSNTTQAGIKVIWGPGLKSMAKLNRVGTQDSTDSNTVK